jgi:phosphoserine aminotransferase
VTDRVVNFAAGPATLPVPVLEEARRDLLSLPGVGISPLEISHRSSWFGEVIGEAEANLRLLLAIPDTYRVAFVQGGATMQFSMVAMNLLQGATGTAGYVLTGSWGVRALAEAGRHGRARALWDGKAGGYVRVPAPDEPEQTNGAAYVHITANETIQGVEWPLGTEPVTDAPLVCDASSDLLSRPLDVSRYGLLYASAQKNAGPAGVTVAIVRNDLLARIPDGLPTMLDYRTYVDHGSMYNTPPVFAIYVLLLVTRWLRDDVGGLEAQLRINRAKAAVLYDAIDQSGGFYRGHAEPGSRSLMNITFRLPTEDLERTFLAEAAAQGLVELKGHRSVGGIRASIYNAMPLAGAQALAAFMRDLARRAG